MNRIYLDFAAATPLDDDVFDAMKPFFAEKFHNPSALYSGARESRVSLERARSDVARYIGARPSEIIFTAGGSESTNLAIHGVMRKHPEANLVISSVEHDAVRVPAQKYSCTQILVDTKGVLGTKNLTDSIDDKTVLVSIMLANNEIGTIQPVSQVVSIVKEIRNSRKKRGIKTPLYVHTDACQAPLYLDCHVSRLGVDLMTLNGGKIHGPKQSGILYVRAGIELEPLVYGGGQEFSLRSGTENVAFAVGFAKSLKNALSGRHERVQRVTGLRDYLMAELESRFGAIVTGHKTHRIANNVHVIFPGHDNERILFALDEMGVDVASGSACSASKETSSHVLRSVGISKEDTRASVRFSLGKTTTKEEIDQTLQKLSDALNA